MPELPADNQPATPKQQAGGLRTFLIILASVTLSVLVVFACLRFFLFPDAFRPVELSQKETAVLEEKIQRLDQGAPRSSLKPEKYSEENANRSIKFSERELNALLAKNTDLADKMAIDLSDDLASISLLIPLDPELPVFGGKTLRVNGGVALSYQQGKPVVALKGISVWGVPLPNAWLGNLKNVDLIQQYGNDPGFWRSFSQGVDNIQVREGSVLVQLKE